MVSVAMTHLEQESSHRQETNGCGCIPMQLYLQKQAIGWICSMGCGLLTPGTGSDAFLPVWS